MVPEKHKDSVIEHVVKVHESVGDYSRLFLQKLRRLNYVTPKNYLDFVNTYTKLLEEKDKYVLDQVSVLFILYIYFFIYQNKYFFIYQNKNIDLDNT